MPKPGSVALTDMALLTSTAGSHYPMVATTVGEEATPLLGQAGSAGTWQWRWQERIELLLRLAIALAFTLLVVYE